MTFQRLAHGPCVPYRVMHIINKAEEYLEDVHTFLRLPLPNLGLSAGGNYSIALVLFGVIDGLSKTIHPIESQKNPNSRKKDPQFVTLLEDYYPWDLEPPKDSVTHRRACEDLYFCYRNELVHGLASSAPADPAHHRASIYKVEKFTALSEVEIENLEKAVERPHIRGRLLSATVRYRASDDTMFILMEALYWGVRRMIERITYQESIMRKAEAHRPVSKDYIR